MEKETGFPFPDRLIHRFVGGSERHGAKVHGTDDLDIYGVCIEPPEKVLGLEKCRDAASRSDRPDSIDRTAVSQLVTTCCRKACNNRSIVVKKRRHHISYNQPLVRAILEASTRLLAPILLIASER
jgi:RNA repair pathway DNA polymerase beta family protein